MKRSITHNRIRRAGAVALLLGLGTVPSYAQPGTSIGIGTTSPDPSAILDISSTTKGLLPPRMTHAQMMAIPSPQPGLMIYCSDCSTPTIYTYGGSTGNGGTTNWGAIGTASNPNATFNGGTLSCTGTLRGTYIVGRPLDTTNSRDITITPATGGNYTASTNSVAGISFAASGTFFSVGTPTTIRLMGTGTPTTVGSQTLAVNIGGQTCNITVPVISATSGGTAITSGPASGSGANGGNLYDGSPASGATRTLTTTVTTPGTYAITTDTVNGVWYTGTGTFAAAGAGTYTLTANGTPDTSGTFTYTTKTTPAATFTVTVQAGQPSSGGSAIASSYSCNAGTAGTLQVGVSASGATQTITANVTTAGTYSIVTDTVNGVYWLGTGTFAGTGARSVVLTAYGTPGGGTSTTFSLKTTPSCNFLRNISPAATFNCSTATNSFTPSTITSSSTHSGAYSLPYTAGNGQSYTDTTLTVNGITMTRTAGTYLTAGGFVIYAFSGTHTGSNVGETFTLPEGCTVTVGCQTDLSTGTGTIAQMMYDHDGDGNANFRWCAKEVTVAGKVWLDRNLGAYKVATSSSDVLSFGSCYQWGRAADGHQRAGSGRGVDVGLSGTTATLSSGDNPGHGYFITLPGASGLQDWRSPQNNGLWGGAGTNNPCPTGYRVPTQPEIATIYGNGFDPPAVIAMPRAPFRVLTGSVSGYTLYWTSTVSGTGAYALELAVNGSVNTAYVAVRGQGFSVRCIKN